MNEKRTILWSDPFSAVGSYGSGFGQFNAPMGIVCCPDGSPLVVDSGNFRLSQFLTNEVYAEYAVPFSAPGQYPAPLHVGVGPNRMYVADTGNNQILALDLGTAAPLFTISSQLGLNNPSAVSAANDPINERIYIADTGNNRIVMATLPTMDPIALAWTPMVQDLEQENTSAALAYFSAASVDTFRTRFATLGSAQVSQAVAAAGNLAPIYVDDHDAQYFFYSTLGGQQFVFVVSFVMENGQWKIEDF